MRLSGNRITLAAGLAVMLLASIAYGQNRFSLRVNVPFGFQAAGKNLPAGTYFFKKEDRGAIILSSTDSVINLRMPVITSLARGTAGADQQLAFDKVGEKRILSEVWLPGEDGARVNTSASEQKHEVVRLVAKRK